MINKGTVQTKFHPPTCIRTKLRSLRTYKSFKIYCLKKFSLENVLFLESIQLLQTIEDEKQKLEKAKEIFTEFLTEGSLLGNFMEKENIKKIEKRLTINSFEDSIFSEIQKIAESKVEETLFQFQKERESRKSNPSTPQEEKSKRSVSVLLQEIFLPNTKKRSTSSASNSSTPTTPNTPTSTISNTEFELKNQNQIRHGHGQKKNSIVHFINLKIKNLKSNNSTP
eukprot:gene11137-3956_t